MSQTMGNTETASPDYDLHLPVVLNHPLIVIAVSALLLYVALLLRQNHTTISVVMSVGIILLSTIYLAAHLIVKRFTDIKRRLIARDELINELAWRGDEKVLDVGCGNGILTFAAAKRVASGSVIGIDVWQEFAGDSSREGFEKNAEIEGVANKVSLENIDVRKLPYADNTFDVITCGLTMHHILHGKDSGKSISEMVRVLKPGGQLAIYDVLPAVMSSAKLMLQNGLTVNKKNLNMVFGTKAG